MPRDLTPWRGKRDTSVPPKKPDVDAAPAPQDATLPEPAQPAPAPAENAPALTDVGPKRKHSGLTETIAVSGARTKVTPPWADLLKPPTTPPASKEALLNDPLPAELPFENLLKDKLLLAAPRLGIPGRACPALGGIVLVKKIGQGGMGAVYLGFHPRLQTQVAIKVLPFLIAERRPEMIARFEREARLAALVRSPHLVQVMDLNQEEGLHYLVMEFVAGCSAENYLDLVRENGAKGLAEKDTLRIAIAATKGLAAAHAAGIVHRDVKPPNILLPQEAGVTPRFDEAKLADLGLARGAPSGAAEAGTPKLTNSIDTMGTPGLMAPEQAFDIKKAGPAADVFSMAATLYMLLTGWAPFTGETNLQILTATAQKPHIPIRDQRADLKPGTVEVIERGLQKEPSARYPDGAALLEALQKLG